MVPALHAWVFARNGVQTVKTVMIVNAKIESFRLFMARSSGFKFWECVARGSNATAIRIARSSKLDYNLPQKASGLPLPGILRPAPYPQPGLEVLANFWKNSGKIVAVLMNPQAKCLYEFGPFRFDPQERLLQRGDGPVSLSPKLIETLYLLLQNAGHLVEKDDLIEYVWPDAVVEEGNLNKNIFVLRKTLGQWGEGVEYIETVPRRGYRFVAPVKLLREEGDSRAQGSAVANLTGKKVSHYRVLEILGGGGMGLVYRAEDLKLGRRVALKFLPEELAPDAVSLERFQREARAASSLNHPNICTIHAIEEHEGQTFIVMELLEGETLRDLISAGTSSPKVSDQKGLPLGRLLDIAIQVATGLEAAHRKGIIHRDIKPANVFVTSQGQAKILDFGLAQQHEFAIAEPNPSAVGEVRTMQELNHNLTLTRTGLTMGTEGYMSPEQVRGDKLDARTDLFSFGMVLYEMATGQRAFGGDTVPILREAILNQTPTPVRELNNRIPSKLEKVISKALEKDRDSRYQHVKDMKVDLIGLKRASGFSGDASLWDTVVGTSPMTATLTRKPPLLISGFLLLVLAAAGAIPLLRHDAKVRWAKQEVPRIAQLFDKQDYAAAYRLLRQVEPYVSDDPLLNRLLQDFYTPVSITTTPPGADVFVKLYSDVEGSWNYLGKSPLHKVVVPSWSLLRWKILKAGYNTIEVGDLPENGLVLDRQGSLPERMVRVPKGEVLAADGSPVETPGFLIDKYEVTNREFKRFVEAGGYRKPEYWKEKFVNNHREISWEEAMSEFHDATNRPGPSNWELGEYGLGQDELPVSGVSWYEASAYAAYVGKSLPTIYEWKRASRPGIFSDIVQISNFAGKSPAQVGSYQGLGPYGTSDMAGNVKEWCWNATGDRRYILGGGWNELPYMYTADDALSPFQRSAATGLRLVKHLNGDPYSDALMRPVEIRYKDYTKLKPVSEKVFQVYASLYSFDREPLDPKVEEVDTEESWRRERVTFNAAYGKERVIAYLFLPKNVRPPYETVIYFPHAGAFAPGSSKNVDLWFLDFIIKSGRAVIFPIYKGTYERFVQVDTDSQARDTMFLIQKDLARSVDYLETRPDIDRTKLAYYHISSAGPMISISLEKRFKTAVLVGVGIPRFKIKFPEVDSVNFAPHVKIPVLMINGRYDFNLPLESSQTLFRLLGTPTSLKRQSLLEAGHVPQRSDIIRETLDWLDRYLGPVN
jgi:serine/threonine protein kinase